MNIKEEIKKYKELEKISDMWDLKLEETIETDKYTISEAEKIEEEFDKAYENYFNQRMVIINIIIKYTNVELSIANAMLSNKKDYTLELLSKLQ